jgi:hypothetical protein
MLEGEMYTEFWWGNLEERNQMEAPPLDRKITLNVSSGRS